jgi:glycosyltransferase involved in cell wall biosynthesis
MPKVSIVMPVYNVEQFVEQAIASVYAQNFADFELLVIDDCSPDNSIDICRRMADPRLHIIHHTQNRGLAGARNTGIRHARSPYIAFLDSDDAWHPDKLACHVAHLDRCPDIGLSFSRSRFMAPDGQLTDYYQMPKLNNIDVAYCLCRNPIGNGSAAVVRREAFEAICYEDDRYGQKEKRYFDEDLRQSEDIECWLRLLATTKYQVAGIPEALTYYRLNAGGLSAQLHRQFASWEAMLEKIRRLAPDVVAFWERPARAYQLRYLGRQAIRLKDGKTAVSFVNRALSTSCSILRVETGRTLSTLVAAYLLYCLPMPCYRAVEKTAHALVGVMQQRSIRRDITQRTNGIPR